MNKKRIWFFVPGILFPYMVLAFLGMLFFSSRMSLDLMEVLFQNNIWYYLLAFLGYLLMAFGLCLGGFGLALGKKWDAASLAKTAWIVKLIQIPAYLAIFVLGVIFLTSIFLFAFTLVLMLLDYVSILMSGMLCSAAVINGSRSGKIRLKSNIWIIVLQFIFCADVVAAGICHHRLKK